MLLTVHAQILHINILYFTQALETYQNHNNHALDVGKMQTSGYVDVYG